MSPQLLRIEIHGSQKISDFALDLRSPDGSPNKYHVLAGPNGCGKTVILEAILEVLGKGKLLTRPHSTGWLAATLRLENGKEHQIGLRGYWGRGNATEICDSLRVEYISSQHIPSVNIQQFKHLVRQQQGRRVLTSGPEPKDRVWLEQLTHFWQEFRKDKTHFVMTLVNQEDLDVNEWDIFLYDQDRRICSIDNLSSGELKVISMAVPFITKSFDGLLLIDEPELHLHPQWQGRILRALRVIIPDAQMIVASNADDPWDDAMSWERTLLVPKGDPRKSTR
jgi:hypothetical protein